MQEAVAIADEFLESMVLEVDVFHSAVENWVLGDSDACLVVFIEFDGSFVVIARTVVTALERRCPWGSEVH